MSLESCPHSYILISPRTTDEDIADDVSRDDTEFRRCGYIKWTGIQYPLVFLFKVLYNSKAKAYFTFICHPFKSPTLRVKSNSERAKPYEISAVLNPRILTRYPLLGILAPKARQALQPSPLPSTLPPPTMPNLPTPCSLSQFPTTLTASRANFLKCGTRFLEAASPVSTPIYPVPSSTHLSVPVGEEKGRCRGMVSGVSSARLVEC